MKKIHRIPKVAVISLPQVEDIGLFDYWIPRGPMVVASLLKEAGLYVRFINMDSKGIMEWYQKAGDLEEKIDKSDAKRIHVLKKIIQADRPGYVLFSLHGLMSLPVLRRILTNCEGLFAGKKIVIGGPAATAASEIVKKHIPEADLIVRGHLDEENVKGFIAALRKRTGILSLKSISEKYSYNINEKIFLSQILPRNFSQTIHLEFVRGCPFGCKFCSIQPTFKTVRKSIQLRDIPSIEKELAFFSKAWAGSITIDDPTFGIHKKHTESILEILERYGIIWHAMTRTDLVDRKTMTKYFKAGCRSIALGVESFEPRTLEESQKCSTVKKSHRAIDILKKASIEPVALIILGLDREERFHSLCKNLYKGKIEYVVPTIYHPTPGTGDFEKVKDLPLRDFEDLDFLGLPVLKTHDKFDLIAQYTAIRLAYKNPYSACGYVPKTSFRKTLAENNFEYHWLKNDLYLRFGRSIVLVHPPRYYGDMNAFELQGIKDARSFLRNVKHKRTDLGSQNAVRTFVEKKRGGIADIGEYANTLDSRRRRQILWPYAIGGKNYEHQQDKETKKDKKKDQKSPSV